jgi:hypothetical protein
LSFRPSLHPDARTMIWRNLRVKTKNGGSARKARISENFARNVSQFTKWP